MELSRPRRPQRPRRRSSAGLTLIELLVSVSILAMIGGALGGAFAAGIHVLAPGGAQSRLAGSHDLLAFEQSISADVARASCIAAPGMAQLPSGGCTASSFPSRCGSSYQLCLEWYLPGDTVCHTIVYAYKQYYESPQLAGDKMILRVDRTASTSLQVTTNPMLMTASWVAQTATGESYKWTTLVSVNVTQHGAPGAPTLQPTNATLQLVPRAVDPLSPVAPSGSRPC
ncbi:MAG: prepilin-type N-terminal cleavage/methylation domain-containing protein [Candidatus Dormibacteraeota bacterium]|nr:prepilin-type N-terminal cleavage/methylation domain-containing protein [Candidatus Dormibacteraeota bacterium]MBV9526334.1 prepilin-type N-terminal cleavage/methylation domain-containing protein [Candidatus Dormibacteraeota bacterium]